MWVKICANTTLEDTLCAIEAGADAVGFVFAPSKRQVTATQVSDIVAKLPHGAERVGVFTSLDPSEIICTVRSTGLDTIQLHGAVEPKLIQAIERELPGIAIIQTITWIVGSGADAESKAARQLSELTQLPGNYRVLIDSKIGESSGGTGVRFDWVSALNFFARLTHLRIIVAGGLTPENVAVVIETLSPWGVDTASGVERLHGIKDPRKVRGFLRSARAAARNSQTA